MIFCGLDKTQRTKIYGITFHAILKVFILTTFNENCWHRQTTPWLICRVEDGVSRKTCVQFCSFSRIFNHYYKLKGINQENNWRITGELASSWVEVRLKMRQKKRTEEISNQGRWANQSTLMLRFLSPLINLRESLIKRARGKEIHDDILLFIHMTGQQGLLVTHILRRLRVSGKNNTNKC